MIRNLKALGLALVAVFAMSGVAVSAASAQGKFTSDGPVALTGTETGGENANAWTMFGLKTQCPGSTYTGGKVLTHAETTGPPPKTHELIPNGSATATITPHYKQANHNCKVNGVFPATIHMNGCDYVVHLGATKPGIDTYAVTFDIVCPPGKEITKTVWTTTDLHTSQPNSPFCVIHIPPQVGLTGAHVRDTTNGNIDLEGTIKGVSATRTVSATHPVLCPHSTTTTGEIDIDITVSGHNGAGGATAVSLSH
jgi:hypothetical protein